jgi:hypothetical protein
MLGSFSLAYFAIDSHATRTNPLLMLEMLPIPNEEHFNAYFTNQFLEAWIDMPTTFVCAPVRC